MIGGAAAGVWAFSVLCGFALEVGPREIKTLEVPTDQTQTTSVSIGPGGCLYKTGAGVWTLPAGLLGWDPSPEIVIKEGGFELETQSGVDAPAPCPHETITAKALWWYDASLVDSRPALFDTRTAEGRTFLDTLYDVRETDSAACTRPRAVALHNFRYVKADGSVATSQNAAKVLSPEIVMRGGRKALWFGGVGTGRQLAVYRAGKNATESTKDVVHLFAVTEVVEGWGNALGGLPSSGIYWGDASHSLNNAMLSIDSAAYFLGNRTYLNGERVDPLTDFPRKGLQVFECELTSYKCTGSAIFSGGAADAPGSVKIAADDDGSRATVVQPGGGDYLYEIIAFTNRLTGVERQKVSDYLRAKWTENVPRRPRLRFAAGTSYACASDGESAYPLARAGRTSFVKKGSGVMTVARDRDDPALYYGEIDVRAGAVDMKALAPVKVRAGDRITARYTADASRVSTAALDADGTSLEKDGNGDALVRAVPSAVKRLNVTQGRLVVHPVGPGSSAEVFAGEGDLIEIPNASFEDWSGTDRAGTWGNDFWTPWKGWTLLDGVTSKSSAAIYNIDNWGPSDPGMDKSTRSAWALNARPHDGACALVLRYSKTAERGVMTQTALSLAAGRYELTYWSNGRAANTGALMDILLVEEATKTRTVVGRQVQSYTVSDGFGPVRLCFDVAVAGRYHLGFRSRPDPAYDMLYLTAIDDIKLRRIGTNEHRWPIPGGDLELLDYPQTGRVANRTFSAAITHEKWTLTQPAGVDHSAVGTDLGVGFANRHHHDPNQSIRGFYNDSDAPYLTAMMTFFGSGAKAQTVFTPPAGTWRLRAKIAENGQNPVHGLTADAVVGGTSVSLGSVSPKTKVFSTFDFTGGTIVADGQTPVTLTLVYTRTGDAGTGSKRTALYLDDVELVRADVPKNGCTILARADRDDHRSLAWGTFSPTSSDIATGVDYETYPSYAGDGYGGKLGLIVRNSGLLYFDYTFPGPGTYRFTFFANNVLTAAGVNPLRVWIADAAETNLLGVVRARAASEVEYAFTFRIPEGGSYARRIGLQGSNRDWMDEEGKNSGDVVVDNVSVAKVPEADLIETDTVFAPETAISVADRAKLELDFIGTNAVASVRLGGRSAQGLISAKTHPDFLSGPGALYVAPRGTLILIK